MTYDWRMIIWPVCWCVRNHSKHLNLGQISAWFCQQSVKCLQCHRRSRRWSGTLCGGKLAKHRHTVFRGYCTDEAYSRWSSWQGEDEADLHLSPKDGSWPSEFFPLHSFVLSPDWARFQSDVGWCHLCKVPGVVAHSLQEESPLTKLWPQADSWTSGPGSKCWIDWRSRKWYAGKFNNNRSGDAIIYYILYIYC